MSELLPSGKSEGYEARSDEAAPLWSSWKARLPPALFACWTSKRSPRFIPDLCGGGPLALPRVFIYLPL